MSNQTTPLATDLYSSYMAEKYDDRNIISVPTGGLSFFGNPMNGGMTFFTPNSLLIEIDIIRGNKKLAAMIQRGMNSRPVARQLDTKDEQFTNVGRVYPLMEEEDNISAHVLNFRMAGENRYEARERQMRLRERAMNAHMEHVRRMIRTCEFLAWQSLLTGSMPAILGTSRTDLQYDFYRRATHDITVSVGWNQTTNTILADIDLACERIRANGHMNADGIILGDSAMEAFVLDSAIATLADNRRFELVSISGPNMMDIPQWARSLVMGGLLLRGKLNTPKNKSLYVFGYQDSYDDASGTDTKYLPVDQGLVFSSQARCDRYFGPPEMLPMTAQKRQYYMEMFGMSPEMLPGGTNIKNADAVASPEMFYFDAYEAPNGKSITCRSQMAPIFATNATDGFVRLQGLYT